MIASQFEFVPIMIQGAGYNCSAVMEPGQAWSDKYGVKRVPFGIYSIIFGILSEILYVPCVIGLGKDMHSSCIKIMFCLAILDMIALLANSVFFGIIMIEGGVYCSNPVMNMSVGIVGYGAWCTATACCVLLALDRLLEVMDLSKYFSATTTNIYLGMCFSYGLFMVLFTRPVLVNSAHQSMFFSPFIPGHSMDEYLNVPHAVHNIVIAASFCLLYLLLCIVLMLKSRSIIPNSMDTHRNVPIFVQCMLICSANLAAASIYVYMNFLPVPPLVIVIGHVAWQLSHGLPPFIYLTLNKSIRNYALELIGLREICTFAFPTWRAFIKTHSIRTRKATEDEYCAHFFYPKTIYVSLLVLALFVFILEISIYRKMNQIELIDYVNGKSISHCMHIFDYELTMNPREF